MFEHLLEQIGLALEAFRIPYMIIERGIGEKLVGRFEAVWTGSRKPE
jgi:hypothetical protein